MTTSKDPNVIGAHYKVDGEVHTRVPRLRRNHRGVHREIADRLQDRANRTNVHAVDHDFSQLSINEGVGNVNGAASLSNFYPSLMTSNGTSSNNSSFHARNATAHESFHHSLCQVNSFNEYGVTGRDFSSMTYQQSTIRDSVSDNGRQTPRGTPPVAQVQAQAQAQAKTLALAPLPTQGGSIGQFGVSPAYLQQMIQQICSALDMSFSDANMSKIIDKISNLKTSQSVSFQTQTWQNERNNLQKKIASLQESISDKNNVIKALNLDVQDLKQVESQQVGKIELLEAQLKESSLNAAKTISELLECKSAFESFESESNGKFEKQEDKIVQLETSVDTLQKENHELSENLDNCKLQVLNLTNENQTLSTNLQSLDQSHSDEKSQLEKKLRHLKKQVVEKDSKLESLVNQIATTKTKCNRKITTLENEHGTLVDSLSVEIQILRRIINKYFEAGKGEEDGGNGNYPAGLKSLNGLPPPTRSKSLSIPKNDNNNKNSDNDARDNNNNVLPPPSTKDLDPINSASTAPHAPTALPSPSTTTTLYLHQLYETRYLQALKHQKDLSDSNTIYNSTVANLLSIHLHYLTKFLTFGGSRGASGSIGSIGSIGPIGSGSGSGSGSGPGGSEPRLAYFKLLIKEYQTRKLLNGGDLSLMRKIVEVNGGLMAEAYKRVSELDKYVL
ncbi:unnamed protein product [Candida parapsilosis]|nr:unnamed protein product [Candida parapsilosis]